MNMNKKGLEENIVTVLKRFGSNVQTLRVKNNKSVAVLAKECELTEETLTSIENGTWEELDILTMLRLAQVLDTHLHLLV
jgi:transcriptional regulator with XRE-family HTH domain